MFLSSIRWFVENKCCCSLSLLLVFVNIFSHCVGILVGILLSVLDWVSACRVPEADAHMPCIHRDAAAMAAKKAAKEAAKQGGEKK